MLEVLEYLLDRIKDKHPVTTEVNGQAYAVGEDGTLGEPIRELPPQFTAPTLQVTTLSGLAEAYKAGVDNLADSSPVVHVAGPREVAVLALKADEFGRRHTWIRAIHAEGAPFQFGRYYVPEEFLIAFRSSFLFEENAVKVQQLCSAIQSGSAVSVADDGISQEVTVKSGTVTKNSIALPQEGIPLVPWRTFRDAPPVMSKFLLRMKGVKDGLPQIAIFEVDGMWQLETMQSIATWLEENLPDGATVIC